MIDGKKSVFIVHSSLVLLDDLAKLCKEIIPEVEVRNIVDDSLLKDVIRAGMVTTAVKQRMCGYFAMAEQARADLILVQCSSLGEVAEYGAELVSVPVMRIDERMAEQACATGSRIGVVATLETTLGPTSRLVERIALQNGQDVDIVDCLCSGAFEAVSRGDKETHNNMVVEAIQRLSGEVDVILCAQGSMAALLTDPRISGISVPILTSLRSGIESVRDRLNEQS